MNCRSRFVLCVAAILVAVPVFAQDHGDMDEQAMMEVWMKAATPGDVHAYLASFEGTWTVTSKIFMDPSQPPMEATGTAKNTMILGGRFLQDELESTMMGMPMQGLGITGYNNTTGQIEFTWMDNMGTMMMMGAGTIEGKTMTLFSTYMDPMMQKETTSRLVTVLLGPDEYTFTMYAAGGDEDMVMMEAHYTRKK